MCAKSLKSVCLIRTEQPGCQRVKYIQSTSVDYKGYLLDTSWPTVGGSGQLTWTWVEVDVLAGDGFVTTTDGCVIVGAGWIC